MSNKIHQTVTKTETKKNTTAVKPDQVKQATAAHEAMETPLKETKSPSATAPKLEANFLLEQDAYEKDLALRYRPRFASEFSRGLDAGTLWKGCKKPTAKLSATMPKLAEFSSAVKAPTKAKMVRYEAVARFVIKEEGDWLLLAAPHKGAWGLTIGYKDGVNEELGLKPFTAQAWADEQRNMAGYTANPSAFAKLLTSRLATA